MLETRPETAGGACRSIPTTSERGGTLRRSIDWRGAFWVASGVPALVLFSIGGIASTTGRIAFLIWALSMVMGFLQSFTYAEIAGLFPDKSGGASIYGAAAWLPYCKLVAPLSVWCNWIAWTPVLSLGCSIAAAYILNVVAPIAPLTEGSPEVAAWLSLHPGRSLPEAAKAVSDAAIPTLRTWTVYSGSVGPVSFSFNATFFIGVVLMLMTFAVQHRGIMGTASLQKYIGLLVIVPLLIVAGVPLITGRVDFTNFSPLLPLASIGSSVPGAWDRGGLTLTLGGMFIAAWSTYGFETAICYTSEFKNPGQDTFKAIFYSGLLCLVIYIALPFTVQGVLGIEGMLAPSIVDGSGVADAIAGMVGGGPIIHGALVVLMFLALMLCITTAMAGSSRTLYQGSVDGWLPRYLDHVNEHGAPTRAMWTDLVFNLALLAVASADSASFFFVLAVSNCGYIIFNFLNLNAGWIHRIDRPHIHRPWRSPTWLLWTGAVLSYVNAVFLGAGAKVWSPWALWAGILISVSIIPVFFFRHYIQDKGRFPSREKPYYEMDDAVMPRRAGFWPYLTIVTGIGVVLVSNYVFHL